MLEIVTEIAKQAGLEILKFYGGTQGIAKKADDSPLTLADQAAHISITHALKELTPEIPVISEESTTKETAYPRSGKVWLVDPLDGTKEFIKQTGEFTVNIALVEDGLVRLGVVYVPTTGLTYFASKEGGAWKQENGAPAARINVRPANSERLCVVASKDHAGPEVGKMLEKLPNAELASIGSSLKFCLVAEGKADCYPRFVGTMEWDTAAAQCVVEEAGGEVLTLDGMPLMYQKSALLNPSIITIGDREFHWFQFLEREPKISKI